MIIIFLLLAPARLVSAADLIGLPIPPAPAPTAPASGRDQALVGLDSTANKGGIKGSQTDLPLIIGKVVGAGLAFVGVIFFCLVLWGGFSWMLAKGNEEEIKKAKETIITAALGLIVILGAYAITKLIADVFSNALTGSTGP